MNYPKIEYFLSENYSNLGNIVKINKIKHNNINSLNYFISTTKGNFVLREFSNNYTFEKIKKICNILNYCYQKKQNVPKPIKQKNQTFVNTKNKFYLTNYYDGIFYNGSSIQLRNLAKSIAHLHKILKKFPINYKFYTSRNYDLLSISELNKIKKILRKSDSLDKYDELVKNNLFFLNSLLSDEYFNRKPSKCKKQLIHNDLHPQNVLFLKNSIPVILDFNSMHTGFPIEDVAFASFRFAISKSLKINNIETLMNSFVANYQTINPLDQGDLEDINFFLKKRIFSLLSYVLREKYFNHSDLWINYLSKHLKSLKFLEKINLI